MAQDAPAASGSGQDAASGRLSPAHAAWLRTLARTARPALWLAGALPLLGGALMLYQAWLLAQLLDAAIVQHAARDTLLPTLLLIAALILARAALAAAGELAGQHASEQIRHQLRLQLFDQILQAGPTWSRQHASGELASALTVQIDALDGYFARYLPAVGAAALLPLAYALALAPADLAAALILLFTLPLIPLFMALAGWGAEAASRRHLQHQARLSGLFVDRLRGLLTLRLLGRAEDEAQRVAQASETLRRRTLKVLRIAFLSSAVLEFFAALGVAGMALYFGLSYLGLLDLRSSPLTLQTGLFCLLMAPEAYLPLRQLAAHYHDRGAARAAVVQLESTLGALPPAAAQRPVDPDPAPTGLSTVLSTSRATPATRAAGAAITLPALWLPGREDSASLLPPGGLSLEPGEQLAVTGHSGAGKSTLLETLAGLRSSPVPVRLDGRPLADWPAAALRARMVLIGQRPYLYADTLAANIRLGRPDASDEALQDAARRAGVLDFARELPQGLNTRLGARGHGLSGGQRHRLALARLYLRDPGLILLDEPTAHLDPGTREAVLDALLTFAGSRTLIIATHDPAVARRLPKRLHLPDAQSGSQACAT